MQLEVCKKKEELEVLNFKMQFLEPKVLKSMASIYELEVLN